MTALARRNIYAITSFIFGMDNDTPGVADRTVGEIESWQPGLARIRTVNAISVNSAVRSSRKSRPPRPSEALARFRAVRHGTQAAENDDRRRQKGNVPRMVPFLQPGA